MRVEEAAIHSEGLTEFGVAPPHPELKRLDPLLGSWKAEEQTLDSVFGPGVSARDPSRGMTRSRSSSVGSRREARRKAE
jgi:hypothetical protein